jgi:hypothetical protein
VAFGLDPSAWRNNGETSFRDFVSGLTSEVVLRSHQHHFSNLFSEGDASNTKDHNYEAA